MLNIDVIFQPGTWIVASANHISLGSIFRRSPLHVCCGSKGFHCASTGLRNLSPSGASFWHGHYLCLLSWSVSLRPPPPPGPCPDVPPEPRASLRVAGVMTSLDQKLSSRIACAYTAFHGFAVVYPWSGSVPTFSGSSQSARTSCGHLPGRWCPSRRDQTSRAKTGWTLSIHPTSLGWWSQGVGMSSWCSGTPRTMIPSQAVLAFPFEPIHPSSWGCRMRKSVFSAFSNLEVHTPPCQCTAMNLSWLAGELLLVDPLSVRILG